MENNENAAPVEQVESAPESIESDAVEGAEAEEAKPAPVEAKRTSKIKLKLDNEEIEEELPFDLGDNPEAAEYLRKNLQLSKVAQKRMQERAELENKVDALLEMLENNTEEVLRRSGKDPEKWAVEYLQNKLKEAEMSPHERELATAKKELEALKAERDAEKKATEEKQTSLMRDKAEQYYEQTILEALEKSKVPKTAKMVHNMAQHMYYAAERNSPIDVETLAEMVHADYVKEMREYVKAAPDDFVEDLVGKERISSYRKKAVMAVKKAAESLPSKITATGETSKQPTDSKSGKGTSKISDFLRGV